MSYTLIEIVRNLENSYGRHWWENPNHDEDLWNKKRIKWLEEHKDDNRKYLVGKKLGSYYRVTNNKSRQKAQFKNFRELKNYYFGKDGELYGVISGVERSGLTIAQAKPIFSKYGYDLEIVIPK